jgi:transcriptional regulator with XRE-family HTH domain
LNKLRVVREEKGLKQRELAEKAHICQTTISEFERGTRKPWPSAMRKLSKVLGVPESELFEAKS